MIELIIWVTTKKSRKIINNIYFLLYSERNREVYNKRFRDKFRGKVMTSNLTPKGLKKISM